MSIGNKVSPREVSAGPRAPRASSDEMIIDLVVSSRSATTQSPSAVLATIASSMPVRMLFHEDLLGQHRKLLITQSLSWRFEVRKGDRRDQEDGDLDERWSRQRAARTPMMANPAASDLGEFRTTSRPTDRSSHWSCRSSTYHRQHHDRLRRFAGNQARGRGNGPLVCAAVQGPINYLFSRQGKPTHHRIAGQQPRSERLARFCLLP